MTVTISKRPATRNRIGTLVASQRRKGRQQILPARDSAADDRAHRTARTTSTRNLIGCRGLSPYAEIGEVVGEMSLQGHINEKGKQDRRYDNRPLGGERGLMCCLDRLVNHNARLAEDRQIHFVVRANIVTNDQE